MGDELGPAVADALLGDPELGLTVVSPIHDASGSVVDFRYELASPAAEALIAGGPLRGRRLLEVIPDIAGSIFERYVTAYETGVAWSLKMVFSAPRTPHLTGVFRVRVVRAGRNLVITFRDITSEERSKQALQASERRFRTLVEHAADVIHVFDVEGKTVYASPAIETILGHSQEDAIGLPYTSFVHPDDHERADDAFARTLQTRAPEVVDLDLRGVRTSGEVRWLAVRASNYVDDASVEGVVVNWRDVTDRHELAESLRQQATHDHVTGLPNRRLFTDHLQLAVHRAARTGHPLVVGFCDLDHFKQINDTYGHGAGDEILVQVATRLRGSLRPADTVARFGGDEFVILCEDLQGDAPEMIVQRAQQAASGAYRVQGNDVHVGISVGASVAAPPIDAAELLAEADAALYEAKRVGRNRFEIYSKPLREMSSRRERTEAGLRRAVERGELVLHYQPKIELATHRLAGVEALLRWEQPGGHLLTPDHFLDVGEDTGLTAEIGAWVLQTACEQAARWAKQCPRPLPVAVNLSARQFRHRDVVEHVDEVLAVTGVDPRLLELEVAETLLLADGDHAGRALDGLRARGVSVALDDFGTGYSSLVWLQRLPVDAVKLDRTFVHRLSDGRSDVAVVDAVIHLAHALGMRVVAEGVEDEHQLRMLTELGCDEAQGFLLARPGPPESISAPR